MENYSGVRSFDSEFRCFVVGNEMVFKINTDVGYLKENFKQMETESKVLCF